MSRAKTMKINENEKKTSAAKQVLAFRSGNEMAAEAGALGYGRIAALAAHAG